MTFELFTVLKHSNSNISLEHCLITHTQKLTSLDNKKLYQFI